MGFLKKIFKPVSKVLDKIVPNEVKPFLPYAAAFAPMLAPGIMGAFGNSMMSRGLISGGLNLGSQLAQEGNEGDVNLLSTLMASGVGALSAPDAASKLQGMKFGDTTGMIQRGPNSPMVPYEALDQTSNTYLQNLANKGLSGLAEGSEFISKGLADKFGKEGLYTMAGMAGQGTMDKAYADAQLAMRDYENSQGGGSGYEEGDQNRGLAVRRAMERGGHEEQTIQDMLESLGYEDPDPQPLAYGGRVGYEGGGGIMDTIVGMFKKENKEPDFNSMAETVEAVESKPKEMLVDKLRVTIMPGQSEMRAIIEAMYNDTDGVMSEDRKKEFYELYSPQMYRNGEMNRSEFEFIQSEILGKDMNKPIARKDGGMMSVLPEGIEMDYRGGGFIPMGSEEKADDVPARVSKNEFVMTADAVKAAGGGSVNEGAKRMYDLMNNLEARA